MRRAARRGALCAVTIATLLAVPASAESPSSRTVDGRVDDWLGESTAIGGTSRYSRGEFVYQDHVYDDTGADTRTRSEQQSTTGATSGDYRYPTDEERYGYNAADLLELRVAADRDDMFLLARMNTLKVGDSTVISIGLDVSPGGGGPWPHSAGVSAAGVDRVVTLWGTGGDVTVLPSGTTTPLDDVAVDVTNGNNAIEARVPRSALGGATAVRLWAVIGLWDGASASFLAPGPGSPTASTPGGGSPLFSARAFNAAFRTHEEGAFMEDRQGATLASGDISAFHADVDLSMLVAGATSAFEVERGRFHSVIVDEGFSIPPLHDGMSYAGQRGRFEGAGGAALTQTFDYFGRHQPYGLYVPTTHDGVTPHPAALALHGHGGSHSTYNSQPGFLRDMGEGTGTGQRPMYLITPLARGSSFYADWGEASTLAALDDALARLPIDPERVYLTGYSMGGYGTYRLASLYPDRFAAAGAWAGYTGEFWGNYLTDAVIPGTRGKAAIGNPVDTLENLRHLPTLHLAGTNDEIVPTTGQYAAPRRLSELGYRNRFDLYPGYEHFSFALVDDWKQMRTWLGDQTRVRAPREITYRFSDGWTAPGLADDLGLVHGRAWWLRRAEMRTTTTDGLTLATVDASSDALPAPAITTQDVIDHGTAPTPHLRTGVAWSEGATRPVANRLRLSLDGVAAVTVDTARAGLSGCGLAIEIETDGPTTIRLRGGFTRAATVGGLDGVTAKVAPSAGTMTITTAGAADGIAHVTCSGRPRTARPPRG